MKALRTALLLISLSIGSLATAQDSIHFEFKGRIYDGFIGNLRNLKIIGDYAYLATDIGVAILDISDPTAPTKVGLYDGFTPDDIAVCGEIAYFAFSVYHIGILDISDPTEPEYLGFWGPLPIPCRLEVVGNIGYFLGTANLYIMDLSEPASPETLSTTIDSFDNYTDMAISGHFAYITTIDAGLKVVDIADSTEPVEVGSIDLPEECYGVGVTGDYAFVVSYDGLRVIDVSDRANLVEVSALDIPEGCINIAVEGDFVGVTTERSMRIVNIADPANPFEAGSIETQGSWNGISIADGLVYYPTLNAGLSVIDISEPDNPVEIGAYNPIGDFSSIALSGQNAFILSRKDGLRVVDLTDVEAPEEIGSCEVLTGGEDIQIAGDYAFVRSRNWLYVTDISDPTNLLVVDSIGTGDGFDIEGDYLFAVNDYGLSVRNISNPMESVLVGRFEGDFMLAQVAASGNIVVINDYEVGLRLFDVSNPAEPALVGQVAIRYNFPSGDLAISGDYLFIAEFNTLKVMDISNPTNPRLVGSCEIAGYANSIAISGDYVLIASGEIGIQVVDISEPTHPRVIDVNNIEQSVLDVAIGARGEICLLSESTLSIFLAPEVTAVPATETTLSPTDFSLSAFPNPFNSSVRISYSVRQPSLPVRLAIYDISGRLVVDLFNGKITPPTPPAIAGGASRTVTWDASSVGAGVYFVRLEAGDEVVTQKIVLMR